MVDKEASRQPAHIERMPELALWIEVDLDRLEPELGNERRHALRPATILGDGEHRNPVAETGLQPLERGHLAQAWLAPGGPQIEHDELAAEIGEPDLASGGVGERYGWRGKRLGRGHEFAELGPVGHIRVASRGRSEPRRNDKDQQSCGTAPFHRRVLILYAEQPMTGSKKPDSANPLWGGRFADGPSRIMRGINASIDVDKRLYAEDIAGSKAHCAMLVAQNILSPQDGAAISNGLEKIRREIESGSFVFSADREDIHMNIEARLAELIGPAAGRLHTARSRNDQVATDLRLWLRGAIDRLDAGMRALQEALIDRAEAEADTVMPGYTHLQIAQPITLGHHFLAYVEMLGRDRGRLADCRRRLNQSPLGAAALAGTSFPIDR